MKCINTNKHIILRCQTQYNYEQRLAWTGKVSTESTLRTSEQHWWGKTITAQVYLTMKSVNTHLGPCISRSFSVKETLIYQEFANFWTDEENVHGGTENLAVLLRVLQSRVAPLRLRNHFYFRFHNSDELGPRFQGGQFSIETPAKTAVRQTISFCHPFTTEWNDQYRTRACARWTNEVNVVAVRHHCACVWSNGDDALCMNFDYTQSQVLCIWDNTGDSLTTLTESAK